MRHTGAVILLLLAVFYLSGCATVSKCRKTEDLEREIKILKGTIEELKKEKETKVSDLEKAKGELAQSLKKEIGEYKAKLQMTERGLIITFLAEIFFDSGKDKIRDDAKSILEKVARVLNENVSDSLVAIEGHTDNEPIRYSSWKSNWELSANRALSVLHYFIDECKIEPQRLSANGYGEFRPVVPNDTAEGRQKNRRVEIVIFPSKLSKIKAEK
jgi:chemotaxis protein MotB